MSDFIRPCSTCGMSNRIPARHLAHRGKCGKCGASLPAQNEPLNVSASEFEEILRSTSAPILVDFWAAWCGPCRMAAPHLKKVAAEMAGSALVLKVDTETNQELAARYRVSGIPNFMVVKDGKVLLQQAGLVDAKQMRRWLEQAMAPDSLSRG